MLESCNLDRIILLSNDDLLDHELFELIQN